MTRCSIGLRLRMRSAGSATGWPAAVSLLTFTSPEHLLAMKVLAARRRDADDIRFLVKHLSLTTVDEVLALCAEIFPDEEVPARARLVLEDAFGEP
jgi:hypothetical protein